VSRPEEPIEQVVERLINGHEQSRRVFLKRMGAVGVVAGAGSFLAACGEVGGTGGGTTATTPPTTAAKVSHPKAAIGTLTVSNWPLYIDKKTPKTWAKQNDATLKYLEDINDNESFYAKVRQDLEAGNAIGRDMVILTDWMAARWIDKGFLEEIDKTNVPNAKNLQPSLAKPAWDPERAYTLPWQSGMTGIGYNPKKTGGKLTSVDDLFDPKFKGRVTFLNEWRDSASLMLLADGVDPADATLDDVMRQIDKMDEAAQSGQIRRFTGNDYAKDLAAGNVWACVAWSGDVVQLQADNPDLEFLIPDAGAGVWSDNMMIPQKAGQPYGAETWMNYYYDPNVAAHLAAYVNYFSPVAGAKAFAEQIDPGLAENQLIFPDEDTESRLHPLVNFTGDEERQATARMQEVTGA
jgi:spermidine/putrescine transport system substrate-binding protein